MIFVYGIISTGACHAYITIYTVYIYYSESTWINHEECLEAMDETDFI